MNEPYCRINEKNRRACNTPALSRLRGRLSPKENRTPMTKTPRATTARKRSVAQILKKKRRKTTVSSSLELLHRTPPMDSCQGGPRHHSSTLRLLLFSDSKSALPQELLDKVLKYDSNAIIKRNWDSVLDSLDSCDVIIYNSDDIHKTLRRINEIWRYRLRGNYATRPSFLIISKTSQYHSGRFEVERLGERFLYLPDVQSQFGKELEQIRLRIADLERSSPRWLIVYEGNGRNLRVSILFLGPRGWHVVRQDDRHAAELAVLIKNSEIARSIAAWREMMMDDLLFRPAGGSFNVPSRTTLRMHIHRDYIRDLQRAFDEARSGYSAKAIRKRAGLGEKTVGYQIKGKWETVRR